MHTISNMILRIKEKRRINFFEEIEIRTRITLSEKSERSIPIATKLSTSIMLILCISIVQVYYQVFKDQILLLSLSQCNRIRLYLFSHSSHVNIYI